MTLRIAKKNLRKESWQRTSGTTKWHKLAQVGTSGTSGTGRSGSPDLRGTKNKGVFRSTWNKWNKDNVSVQLNLSLDPKWNYKAVKHYNRKTPSSQERGVAD